MKDVQAHLRQASMTTKGNFYVQEILESVRPAVNATTLRDFGDRHEAKGFVTGDFRINRIQTVPQF